MCNSNASKGSKMYNREEIIDRGLEILGKYLLKDETVLFYDSCVKARRKVTPVTEVLAATEGEPGLFAFTNRYIFFVQKSGLIKPTYSLEVRIPLEKILHLDTSGMMIKSLKVTASPEGKEVEYTFLNFSSVKNKENKIEKIRADVEETIQKCIKMKSPASKDTKICEYCGEKNAKTNEKCLKCGADLKK
jgi:ribosomal protein L40E